MQFANSGESILLIGESGTGKEMFAQSIQNYSRPNGPFIVVNCAAVPRSLIESELFGYEAGTFTGGDSHGRHGKIELAHKGTLFLDEIGDMPFEVQSVLLRVLQDKTVTRIGGHNPRRVDFRVIAATNKDIFKLVRENLFREDLLFRLSVLCIQLPPLRDRGDDVLVFADYFIQSYCTKQGLAVPPVSADVLKILKQYSWPGNVRQLENVLIYAINACGGGPLEANHLPTSIMFGENQQSMQHALVPPPFEEPVSLRDAELAAMKSALRKTNLHVPKAAQLLGVSKSTLYRKMREYGLEVPQ